MRVFWTTIIAFLFGLTIQGQTYWRDLSPAAREQLSHSGKVSPLARSYFQDPSMPPPDSASAMALLQEIGNTGATLLPFYWQLFSQTHWPASIDTTVAAPYLFNLLSLYPKFIIGTYQSGFYPSAIQQYSDILRHGMATTPFLFPDLKSLRKQLKKRLPSSYRKGIRAFYRAMQAPGM